MILLNLILLSTISLREGGNVVIFPVFSRSQMLLAARMATILTDDGHHVTLILPTNDEVDIKKSVKYDILLYNISTSRDEDLAMVKVVPSVTIKKMLLGEINMTTLAQPMVARCEAFLFDVEFQKKLEELKPDVAIVPMHFACVIPVLTRMGVPFFDLFLYTLMPWAAAHPHRIPAPPSYVPDMYYLAKEPGTFKERLITTLGWLLVPFAAELSARWNPIELQISKYQQQHNFPLQKTFQLRSKASFLLVQGDQTFETIRPLMPKVVYIGGLQCDRPQPLQGELKAFVEEYSDVGIIVFSIGGVLDPESLPDNFFQAFLNVFRDLPYGVVWKWKSVQGTLEDNPRNVKIVEWIPQQDLIGHVSTKLFITHGGVQGSFESICHGIPALGVSISSGDQRGNVLTLVQKGMALSLDDYTTMTETELREKINNLLTDSSFKENAIKAQKLYYDQPFTPAHRLSFAIGYTIRHKGAKHLTSDAALKLNWFQFHSVDVAIFLIFIAFFVLLLCFVVVKKCLRCCYRKSYGVLYAKKTKTE